MDGPSDALGGRHCYSRNAPGPLTVQRYVTRHRFVQHASLVSRRGLPGDATVLLVAILEGSRSRATAAAPVDAQRVHAVGVVTETEYRSGGFTRLGGATTATSGGFRHLLSQVERCRYILLSRGHSAGRGASVCFLSTVQYLTFQSSEFNDNWTRSLMVNQDKRGAVTLSSDPAASPLESRHWWWRW
ncbi:hypothetical protein EYF80_021241 [Liparis tanakae]|uniref:Uncharacterized protein n=1 Tax=Liparis tanakae TaxID=230148 RepID=A0A4Z2HTE9_9TELE|nr:hypothetical protein EYF80_021241 [Liparis tanakae]